MKKLLASLSSLVLVSSSSLTVISCASSSDIIGKKEIILDTKQINLSAGENNNNTDQVINYSKLSNVQLSSSDPSVATAHYDKSSGVITFNPKKEGVATITVSADGSNSVGITVTVAAVVVPSINLQLQNLSLTTSGLDQKKIDKITNYLSLPDINISSDDPSVATAEYDNTSGVITVTGHQAGTATITVSADGTKSVYIDIKVAPPKNPSPPNIIKNIILSNRWGIINRKDPVSFMIKNNFALQGVKISSDNKNISTSYSDKTGVVTVYSNDGLGYWAVITVEANDVPPISFFVFVLNSKYWKEEIGGVASGVAAVAAAVGVSIYQIYKAIEKYLHPAKPVPKGYIDLNQIISDTAFREALEAKFKSQLVNGHELKKSFVESVTSLSLASKGIKDITGIGYFENLTNLDLSDNDISNLLQLSNLSKLTTLNLAHTLSTSFLLFSSSGYTPLYSLKNLKSLDLSGNNIVGTTFLTNLTNLTDLDLSNNRIGDITSIAKMTNLTSLFLGHNYISSFFPLSGLKNLKVLDLSAAFQTAVGLQNPNFNPIAGLSGLDTLYLTDSSISDISWISSLKNLTQLDLSDNSISNLSWVTSLTNLKKLNLSSNIIVDLTPLKNSTSLTNLNLADNKISDVTGLKNLKNLKDDETAHIKGLNLADNDIANTNAAWAPVDNLPNNPTGNDAWDSATIKKSQWTFF